MSVVPPSVFSIRGDQVLKIKPATSNAPFPMINTYPHGMPLGGLGAGTFSISPLGHFNVWHFFPGIHILPHRKIVFFRQRKKYWEATKAALFMKKNYSRAVRQMI
jgi:uncharacterized protein (DUF608 family)